MLTNTAGAQGYQELAVRTARRVHLERYTSWSLVGNAADKPGLIQRLSYLFSEYIRANFVLGMFILGRSVHVINPSATIRGKLGGLFKRGVDLLGAIVGLILTSPLFVILPIVIKLDSPGPVFYRQSRVGHNRRRTQRRQGSNSVLGRTERDRRRGDLKGRPFNVIKFRTMVADAEKKCGPVWATQNDPRITRLGRFMRKTRLDEIPQFINVLLGQMSLVGPRPERPVFVMELCSQVENYDKRLTVKPGLTGLAQIENGYDSSVASVVRKVHYDLEYIQNWSLWQDVKIILRTVVVVVTGKGAF